MRVTVLGAGAGGAAAVAELAAAGHEVALWNRSAETLAAFQASGGVEYEGVLGTGVARPRLMTSDLDVALGEAEAVVCTLPTFAHAPVAQALARSRLRAETPVVLNPGHTGGALEFSSVYRTIRGANPLVAECSTLTYVARKYRPQCVSVSGRAKSVRVAALPGAARAIEVARALFPCLSPVSDVLNSSLANVNMVLHPPGAMLGAAWVEAKAGDFTFYVEGMTPGVARVMRSLDDERRAVARAFGHALPNLIEEMQRIGTVEPGVTDTEDFAAAIAAGEANQRIKAPGSLAHRYYREDFGHGLLPLLELAAVAGVAAPTAAALLALAQTLTASAFRDTGRTAHAMGIAGLGLDQLTAMVRA
jgi:opine dehydrogenase